MYVMLWSGRIDYMQAELCAIPTIVLFWYSSSLTGKGRVHLRDSNAFI